MLLELSAAVSRAIPVGPTFFGVDPSVLLKFAEIQTLQRLRHISDQSADANSTFVDVIYKDKLEK